ncbi:MAG: DUF2764 family protein [Candidatus Riflebacteria bacterium]|nr:DUF2764 family protein [Candidatus Riflebacteria bacterium]
MAANFFYLLTVLPALPALAEPFPTEDVMAKIRDESDDNLLLLADLLECESEIEKCGLQYYVLDHKDFRPCFSDRIPESFVDTFMSFSVTREADWFSLVYAAWFELLIAVGDKTGSALLKQWARWEYSLRTALRIDRLKVAGKLAAEHDAIVPGFMKELSEVPDNEHFAEAYKSFSEPMKAEKFLDQTRIDYLRGLVAQFSFTIDELVAYLLELRIHNRYARLSPEKGRKILKEVTTL